MGLVAPNPWIYINTQTACLTGATFSYQQDQTYIADPNGLKAKQMLYKAYEAIHKYENFHGDTNRRSELNDRVDKVKEWMIEQWPDISTSTYGTSAWSNTLSSLSGFNTSVAAATVVQQTQNKVWSDTIKQLALDLGLYKK